MGVRKDEQLSILDVYSLLFHALIGLLFYFILLAKGRILFILLFLFTILLSHIIVFYLNGSIKD
jgi:hypothetical protein